MSVLVQERIERNDEIDKVEKVNDLNFFIMAFYYELDIWKKSLEVTSKIYHLTEWFPKTELYSLVDQMKRAAISIGSNIAEWSGQWSNIGNIKFLNIARGSTLELEAQIRISKSLWFLGEKEYEEILSEVTSLIRMISAFIKKKREFEK